MRIVVKANLFLPVLGNVMLGDTDQHPSKLETRESQRWSDKIRPLEQV